MADKLFLICDTVGFVNVELVAKEGACDKGGMAKFRGKFQEADATNKNNRIYPYPVLERELGRLQPVIGERRLFGELDHPADSIIHLENASHLITNLWWEGKALMGEGEILPTPAGQILRSIIECGIPIGISSRGVGTAKTDASGRMIIDENFRLITFDCVADPSTHGAFGNPYTGESRRVAAAASQQHRADEAKKSEISRVSRIDNPRNEHIDPNIIIGYINAALRSKSKD